MIFVLKINIDNAAFEFPNAEPECAKLLRSAADQVLAGIVFGNLLDINGNTVGYFDFVEGTHTMHDSPEGHGR